MEIKKNNNLVFVCESGFATEYPILVYIDSSNVEK